MLMPASGYMYANGLFIIGQNPPNTVTLGSSTAGTGITISCTNCFTGTNAGDQNRIFTFYDGGSPKQFTITGATNTGAAVGTLATTLTTHATRGAPHRRSMRRARMR
jgi:hypothetical protein